MYVSLKGDNMSKVFVQVTAEHYIDGKVRPLSLKWKMGEYLKLIKYLMFVKRLHLKAVVLVCDILAEYVISRFIYLMKRVAGLLKGNNETKFGLRIKL